MDIHTRRLPGSNIDQEFYLVSDVEKEIEKWRVAEKEISDAYLRIRKLVGAWDTQEGGVDRFEVTESAIKKLVAFWEWSRVDDMMTLESYRDGQIQDDNPQEVLGKAK